MTFEYPFSESRVLKFPHSLKYVPSAKRALHQTLNGIANLVEWAKQQPAVDPGRVFLVGASFGAPLVSVVAAQKPEVKVLILIHGFGAIPETLSHRLGMSLEKKYGAVGKWIGD